MGKDDPVHRLMSIIGCPSCHRPLEPSYEEQPMALVCRTEGHRFGVEDGIPRLVVPAMLPQAVAVGEALAQVRRLEGWGELPAGRLLEPDGRLPVGLRGSARALQMITGAVEREAWRLQRPLKIAVIGNGIAPEAVDLARQGHAVAAIDACLDERVGLPATRALGGDEGRRPGLAVGLPEAPPVQAQALDVMILRGTLGAVADPRPLLRRIASQVLPPGGLLILADIPVFRQSMAADRWSMAHVARYRERLGLDEPMSRRMAPVMLWRVLPSLERIDCQVEVRSRWTGLNHHLRAAWARLIGDEVPRWPVVLVRTPPASRPSGPAVEGL